MTVSAIQERYPWLMAPVEWVTFLATPERWACAFDRAALAVTRSIVVDTTPLGHFLQRNNMAGPRDALLRRSAALQWVDWKIRKLFWAAVWCSMVFFRNWPHRAAAPGPEKPIRLLSAPETYADFKAPTLVVPDALPCAEKSLLDAQTVQILHLLQEIYPIVSTYQAPADPDPQRRFDRAYSLLYRLTRKPPRWHPDLVEASRSKNLLGALGAGGPFAKLLQRVGPGAAEYVIDLEHFRNYEVREGLCHLGSKIHYVAREGKLAVTGIQYDGRVVTPDSDRWELTERIALAGLMTHVTVWRQGMEYHVGGLAPVPVLTHNYLPPAHPLRRLLAAHLAQMLTTNYHTHLTLRRNGFDVTGFTFPFETILRYYDDGAASFDITRLDVALDAARRGIPDSLEYPYLPQALRYYRIFEGYVRRYVDCYYPDEQTLRGDLHARLWFEALDLRIVGGIRRYVADLTRDTLIQLCALIMYSLCVGHTENSLEKYAMFMPTTVRKDGVQQSVGQVQDIVNFQLLITAPATRLLSDISHLALDARGAAIMRGFRQDLLALQQEMERQPSRHWQLFPNEIEGSVCA